MALLFVSAHDHAEDWVNELNAQMPELDVRVWPEGMGDLAEIDYALVWKPPAGLLASLPKLKVIFSLGAGVDALLADPTLPDLPLVRMVEPGLTEGMTEYVCLHVLRWHRDAPLFEAQQRAAQWKQLTHQHLARERRVGILGLGALGSDAAQALRALRFDVAGWSRSAKHLDGIATYHGAGGLAPFLARTDILVCLLPLTPDTENILDAGLFAQLPRGAVVINAARGRHLVEEDLLAALDSGHLAGATLDVFRTEPLPADHPFWTHPRVTVTPHVAAITQARTAVEQVVGGLKRLAAGQPLINLVDRRRGY
ncbi:MULTISPECIES: 2-hydroxyacid dehydrogenase [Nitrospirillum]|uniref:Glyoxylate/hydroxypyruvate reductase A n=1 Tax=Nitrospirillum amazonense TaxID=28077 RepID=A0A560FQT6_9PROT|nr:glyoxylate/hydroxypyruvate reductase A [Nitrospirillum amazonense]MEC4594598.1 glyoxylate/hydroxypyruvate reductase A [Nitrospirillum amazonense]TWB23983.1 glyoxylate/hydroxypyruvate reductase A [Nitrospirillum amazonense]